MRVIERRFILSDSLPYDWECPLCDETQGHRVDYYQLLVRTDEHPGSTWDAGKVCCKCADALRES